MATKVNFEELKTIPIRVQYSVSGYIRRCQILLPTDNPYYNIPELINFIVLLFYNDIERFTINNSNIFNFDFTERGNYFHLYGTRRIERKYTDFHTWVIETNAAFKGRFGIMNDTQEAIDEIVDNKCYWKNKDIGNVGSVAGGHSGNWFGVTGAKLGGFIKEGDVITITVDFKDNKVSFRSKQSGQVRLKDLKPEIQAIKFCAECCWQSSIIKIVS